MERIERKKKKKKTNMDQSRRPKEKKTENSIRHENPIDLVVCFGAKVFSPFDDRSTRGTEAASAGDVHMASAPDAGESRDI